ncbi:unnamed protein product [Porites evermanni]|uniref:Uncharacterized protein n=1 Tax=Porites evermanni TaxID=104178 RepID=A0ABN8MHG4_9CNID|nr:unnamed protein product [Porites evermanni]
MIRTVLHYVITIWTSCDKENLNRVLKSQKRAATLGKPYSINRLQWLSFYEESKIAKCCVGYKRIKGAVPLFIK